jgi:hypothetical protein
MFTTSGAGGSNHIKFARIPQSTTGNSKSDQVYFFHMNGCGHCQHLFPIWNKAKGIIQRTNPSILFVEVESADIKTLDKYVKNKLHTSNIIGYPDLRILKKNGQTSTFNGDRTVESLVNWISSNTSSSVKDRTLTPYPSSRNYRRVRHRTRKGSMKRPLFLSKRRNTHKRHRKY